MASGPVNISTTLAKQNLQIILLQLEEHQADCQAILGGQTQMHNIIVYRNSLLKASYKMVYGNNSVQKNLPYEIYFDLDFGGVGFIKAKII